MRKQYQKVSEFFKTTTGIITGIIAITSILATGVTSVSRYAVNRYVGQQNQISIEAQMKKLIVSDSIKTIQLDKLIVSISELKDTVRNVLAVNEVTKKYLIKHLNETSFQNEVIDLLQEIINGNSKKNELPKVETVITKIQN